MKLHAMSSVTYIKGFDEKGSEARSSAAGAFWDQRRYICNQRIFGNKPLFDYRISSTSCASFALQDLTDRLYISTLQPSPQLHGLTHTHNLPSFPQPPITFVLVCISPTPPSLRQITQEAIVQWQDARISAAEPGKQSKTASSSLKIEALNR
jgi:hypothetical protein